MSAGLALVAGLEYWEQVTALIVPKTKHRAAIVERTASEHRCVRSMTTRDVARQS